MQILIATLLSMGARVLTASVIEHLIILLVGQLVKRTSSTVDDEAFAVIKAAIEKK